MTRRRISSRDNADFKSLRALAEDPREVRKQGLTLADGPHLVALCLTHAVPLKYLLLSESALGNPEVDVLIARARDVAVLELGDGLFRALSPVASPTGIAAVFAPPGNSRQAPAADAVLLDAVQDPGNVGAIMRSAAAAGVSDVVLGTGCAGAWTPRVLRAAQGAHFGLRIHEQADLSALLATTATRSIATTLRAATSLYDLDLRQPQFWLFGNEGAGLSPDLAERATIRATIPLAAATESLNVAAAAAVCLFEAVRQRR